jgi:hypothetical protein
MASLDDFFVSTYIPTAVEIERSNRIRLAVYAYAYEYESTSLISDGEFDELSKKIDLTISTGNSKIDKWFKKNFEPDTGMWISGTSGKGMQLINSSPGSLGGPGRPGPGRPGPGGPAGGITGWGGSGGYGANLNEMCQDCGSCDCECEEE